MERCSKSFSPFLILFLILTGCGKGCPLTRRAAPTPPTAETSAKLKAISRWIPQSANSIVAIDIHKLSNTIIWQGLTGADAPEFLSRFRSDMGMLAGFAEVTPLIIRGPVLLIQCGLKKDIITSKIIEQAKTDKLELVSEKYKDSTIYSDGETAFAVVDEGIVAIATPNNLKWLLDSKPSSPNNLLPLRNESNKPLWGKMVITKDLEASLPAPWSDIKAIGLDATTAEAINAEITLETAEGSDTKRLITALEGLIAIEAIERLDDSRALKAIDNIVMKSVDGKIAIEFPVDEDFINAFFAKKHGEEKE